MDVLALNAVLVHEHLSSRALLELDDHHTRDHHAAQLANQLQGGSQRATLKEETRTDADTAAKAEQRARAVSNEIERSMRVMSQ